MIAYLKLGGIAALAALLFAAGFYFGGLRSKTAYEALQAAQAEAVAKAVLAERSATAAQLAKQNEVISTYESHALDPLAPIIAQRLCLAPAAGDRRPVPQAPANAGRAPPAAPEPFSPSPVATALGDLLSACASDAARLSALQALSPR
jgi:hypothetical protein